MNLSIIVKASLIFYFIYYQRVSSLRSSFSKYQMLFNDDIDNDVNHFFNHFQMAYLEKSVPRHVTIIGASNEDLRQVQALFERYPYIICTEPETCVYRRQFSPGSFVFFFIDDLREETIEKNVNILSRCRVCKILYIFRGNIENEGVRLLMYQTVRKSGAKAQFMHLEKNVITIYTSLFSNNCSMQIRSTVVWTPGASLNVIDTWGDSLRDLNRCQITLSTLNFAPKILVKEHENGSLIITGGLEGELLSTFAKKLNFTIAARYPSLKDRMKYSRKAAVLNDVATGKTEFGIGQLRPVNNLYSGLAFSLAYDHECVTWAVPRIMTWADSIIWVEFSWQVWALYVLVFVIVSVFKCVCHNFDSSKNGNQKIISFHEVVLDMIATHLGNPAVDVPGTITGRFLMTMCLCYSIVMTTAYKTSLASSMLTDKGSPAIVDAEGIIRENLSVGGSSYNLEFLKDQVNESETISKLIKRFNVINNPLEVMRRLKFDKKFACITRSSALVYEKQKILTARKPITFDILKNCVLDHPTVIVFRQESFLREQADNMIRRLHESGILVHWKSDELFSDEIMRLTRRAEKYFKWNIKRTFIDIFILYSGCIALSFLTFLIELGIKKRNF